MSSNFLFGSIPPKLATMVKLQTLTLDGNYFDSTMPNWFDSLSNLSVLSLKRNHLKGSFPSSLCKIKSLTDISLSHNELSGGLPDLTTLSGLHVLDLRQNHLDSELPLMPKEVVTILLSGNSFSGEIPNQFGELGQLQHLDLSSNHLTKMPTSSLFSLPNMSYLNLESNLLSGSLPHKLKCGSKLGFVDISSNKFNGMLPSCLASTTNGRVVRYSGNCLSLLSQPQKRGSYCEESSSGRMKFWRWIIIAAAAAVIIIVVLVLLALGICFYRKHHSREIYRHEMMSKAVQDNSTTGVSSEFLASARFISQTVKLGTQANPTCRQFLIEELKDITRNFALSTCIGEGSIGKLYKGKLENGSYVVIRSLPLKKKFSIQNLRARLDLLSKLQHPNLVSLLGHCIDGGGQDDTNSSHKLHLVYEYVPNGNYRRHLSEFSSDKALKWSDRLAILIGVAKAVHFLHTGVIPGCLRNQLRTNNVLLDEHRFPKLSDYGMSMIADEIENLEAKGGNPKSCQMEKLEDDVYNFGFILFESLAGPIASDKGEAFFVDEKASFGSQDGRRKIVDPVVLTSCCQESLSIAISITTKCITPESSSRPSFEDVLWNLQYAAQVQATADADQKSDSTP
ncbi:probable inactive leucine-rich repeat receptor-like protein kinase At3g03770 isoform X2 [Lotus japonicus]|nr:probable inactive leucine-rich repeat receptor-like protein kinase At3g03770 isoform X2 [Lotus japonicus]